jgi:hypothetical protein
LQGQLATIAPGNERLEKLKAIIELFFADAAALANRRNEEGEE